MPSYEINAQYEYWGVVDADTPEEAEKLFLDDLNTYYAGTYSFDIDVVEDEEEEEDDDDA